MIKKRSVSFLLSLLIVLHGCPPGAGIGTDTEEGTEGRMVSALSAPRPEEGTAAVMDIRSGDCGAEDDKLTWTLDSAGTLTIDGLGAMGDYWNPAEYHYAVYIPGVTDPPWYDVRSDIVNITINEGVTSIGTGAFSFCASLRSVTIPSTVERIGTGSFYNCSSLQTVHFAGSESEWRSILQTSDSELLSAQIQYGRQHITAAFIAGENALIETPDGGLTAQYEKELVLGEPYGQLPEAVPAPGLSGWSFTGWFTAPEGGVEITADTIAEESHGTQFYAHWYIPVTSVTIQVPDTVPVGKTAQAAVVIEPPNATDKTVIWSSSAPENAAVDENGLITGLRAGPVRISAKPADGVRAASKNIYAVGLGDYSPYQYSFFNEADSFGYSETGNRIPLERYYQVGYPETIARFYQRTNLWHGHCYGMVVSSMLFFARILNIARYHATARTPSELPPPNVQGQTMADRLRSMIELLQISYFRYDSARGETGYHEMLEKNPAESAALIAEEIQEGRPVALYMSKGEAESHEVLIYDCTPEYQEGYQGDYVFSLYDSNRPADSSHPDAGTAETLHYTASSGTWRVEPDIGYTPEMFCTQETIADRVQEIIDGNIAGAAELFSTGEEAVYLACPTGDVEVTGKNVGSLRVTDGALKNEIPGALLVKGGTLDGEPAYVLILPADTYTIRCPLRFLLAGPSVLVSAAGEETVSAEVSEDMNVVQLQTTPGRGCGISWQLYGDAVDTVTLSGTAAEQTVRAELSQQTSSVLAYGTEELQAEAVKSEQTVRLSETAGGRTAKVLWNEGVLRILFSGAASGSSTGSAPGSPDDGDGLTAGDETALPARVSTEFPPYSLPSGEYAGTRTLSFQKDSETLVYYTTDGSAPTRTVSHLYTLPIPVEHSMTVRAVAVRYGYKDSQEMELRYTIRPPEIEILEPSADDNTASQSGADSGQGFHARIVSDSASAQPFLCCAAYFGGQGEFLGADYRETVLREGTNDLFFAAPPSARQAVRVSVMVLDRTLCPSSASKTFPISSAWRG